MSANRVIDALTKNGYTKVSGSKDFSSIVVNGVWHKYQKGDNEVVVGLHINGFPPCLISPRPRMKAFTRFDKSIEIDSRNCDGEIIEFINTLSHEEIVKGIESNWEGTKVTPSEGTINQYIEIWENQNT